MVTKDKSGQRRQEYDKKIRACEDKAETLLGDRTRLQAAIEVYDQAMRQGFESLTLLCESSNQSSGYLAQAEMETDHEETRFVSRMVEAQRDALIHSLSQETERLLAQVETLSRERSSDIWV